LQFDYILPGWNGNKKEVSVNTPAFSARVTHRWIRETLKKDLARSFPQLISDVVAGFSPERLLEGKDPIYGLTRRCLIRAVAR
jgi:hypothetical protein